MLVHSIIVAPYRCQDVTKTAYRALDSDPSHYRRSVLLNFQCCTFGFACCSQFEGLQVVATFAIFSSFILFTITQSPRHIVMKSISMFALAGTAAAATYPDFKIPHLSTHQPSGEKFDYYHIDFNVTSENGGSPSTSWCSA
jgi:hypothetical protein